MFKYFALGLDYTLAIVYELYAPQWSFIVIIPLIFHTLTFIITPHCYANHCTPVKCKKSQTSKQQQTKPTNTSPYSKNMKSIFLEQSHNSSQPPLQIWNPPPFSPNKLKSREPLQQNKSNQCSTSNQYQQCKQCGLTKWIRMQHCYYCNVCVHKYDHHCVLLGICIGESNQKYYIPFLWFFLLSSFIQLITYYDLIGNYLYLDDKGYEHVQIQYTGMSLAIIFFLFSIIIVGYLAVYHTYLALCNDTTYQMRRRPQIEYFRGVIKDHPFDVGLCENIRLIIVADRNKPIQWDRPIRPMPGSGVGVFDGVKNNEVVLQKPKIQRKDRLKLPFVQYHRMSPEKI